MLTLTRETHFIFPGAPTSSLSLGEVDLTPLINRYAPNRTFFYERPRYRLKDQGVVILQTDNAHLAVTRYLEQLTPSTSSAPTQEDRFYSWIDCIKGQIRVTIYFQEQALQTLAQQKPRQWATLFDCRQEGNTESQSWPSELDYDYYQNLVASLIQQIENVPHATDQYPVRVPALC